MRRANFFQIAFLFLVAALTQGVAQQVKAGKDGEARVLRHQGLELFKESRFQDAVETFKRAIQLKPDYAEAHNDLGMAYCRLNRNDEAIESFRQAIRLNPRLAEAYYNLGTAYYNLGRLQEAMTSFKQAVGLKPDYAW